jgi:hypothetical protein
MPFKIRDIKHVVARNDDIDPTQRVPVAKLDRFVFGCCSLAQTALSNSSAPVGLVELEREQLKLVIQGLSQSHKSIRRLLEGDQHPGAVDGLAIARLQLETLYSFCFMIQNPENVRLFLKNGWKKRYIRFLLHREELCNLPRFQSYLSSDALPLLEVLQLPSCVTDAEKSTIEHDELGTPGGPNFTRVPIQEFPTPGRIIPAIAVQSQRRMLERLYPEYQFLCSFAHPAMESLLFRAISDPRSPVRQHVDHEKLKDFYQRQVLEPAVIYSTIAAVQVATEVAAICPADVELLARLAEAWTLLLKTTLLAVPVWEIRGKEVLQAI